MTEAKNPGERTLSVTPTKTLSLKRGVEQGGVRQSFSHGRSKAVVVEKVKRRGEGPTAPVVEKTPAKRGAATVKVATAARAPVAAPPTAPSTKPSGVVLRTLTDEERSRRAHAL